MNAEADGQGVLELNPRLTLATAVAGTFVAHMPPGMAGRDPWGGGVMKGWVRKVEGGLVYIRSASDLGSEESAMEFALGLRAEDLVVLRRAFA